MKRIKLSVIKTLFRAIFNDTKNQDSQRPQIWASTISICFVAVEKRVVQNFI